MGCWCSFYTANVKALYFVIICSVEDLFTLSSNNFKMVYKVDGYPQLDWFMSLRILKVLLVSCRSQKAAARDGFFQLFLREIWTSYRYELTKASNGQKTALWSSVINRISPFDMLNVNTSYPGSPHLRLVGFSSSLEKPHVIS